MKKNIILSTVLLFSFTLIFYITGCARKEADATKTTDAITTSVRTTSYTTAAVTEAKTVDFKIGDIVVIGKYEQDNNKDNGPEDIEWIVLSVEDNKALLISKYLLDAVPFNQRYSSVTWETCTLREWLNKDFYELAFLDHEKKNISAVTVVNEDNEEYGSKGGNDTQDKIYVFSIGEIEKYIPNEQDRGVEATAYARSRGVFGVNISNKLYGFYWLRSPGMKNMHAAYVTGVYVNIEGGDVDNKNTGIRPVFWLDLR